MTRTHELGWYVAQLDQLAEAIVNRPHMHPDMARAFAKLISDLREGLKLQIAREKKLIAQRWNN